MNFVEAMAGSEEKRKVQSIHDKWISRGKFHFSSVMLDIV